MTKQTKHPLHSRQPAAQEVSAAVAKSLELPVLLSALCQSPAPQGTRGYFARPLRLAVLLILASSFQASVALARDGGLVFSITGLNIQNGNVIVRWQGGGTNQLQSRASLQAPWQDVGGPTTNVVMTNVLLEPTAFYRVKDMGAAMAAASDQKAPTTPMGLTSSLAGPARVDLLWSASTDANPASGLKGYNVYRNGVFLKQVASPTTSFSDTSVLPGISYSYQVTAIDNVGNQSGKSTTTTVTIPSGTCNYAIAPGSASFGGGGGSGSVTVSAASGCGWAASSSAGWVMITAGGSGTGGGVVSYAVAANTAATSRSGTIEIAGQTFMVSQAGVVSNDSTPPAAAFLAPADSALVSGLVELKALVTDNAGLGNVEFYVENLGQWVWVGTSTAAGLSSTISIWLNTTNLLNGLHYVMCKPYDQAGNLSYTTIGVTVFNYNADPGIMTWAIDTGRSPLNGEAQNAASKTDSQGNIVLVGKFKGAVAFGVNSLTAQGGYDHFLAKYSPAGALLWVRGFSGTSDNVATGVAVDASDNIIVAGYFAGTVDLGGSPLTSGAGVANNDPFVAKYNSAGTHIWSRRFGGANGNIARAVAVDTNGNVFVAGEFFGSSDLGSGTVQGSGQLDCFVSKFSGQTGFGLWQRPFASTTADYVRGLAVDANGDALVSGFTVGNMDFGAGTVANAGGSDAFMVKYSGLNGGYLWAKMIAGPGDDGADSVSVAPDGNGVLCFTFNGTLDLGGGHVLSAPVSTAMGIARYSSSGSLLWTRVVGGQSSIGGILNGRSSAVDSVGNVVVTGNATGEADFGNGQLTAGTGTIFIAKYSPAGNYIWSKRFSSTGWSSGTGVCVDSARNILATGAFAGTADFEGIQLSTLSTQLKDGYLIKITP